MAKRFHEKIVRENFHTLFLFSFVFPSLCSAILSLEITRSKAMENFRKLQL